MDKLPQKKENAERIETCLETITALLEAHQKQSTFQKVGHWATIISLCLTPFLYNQITTVQRENRENFINRIAYETATQNVMNRWMGRDEGKAQAMQIMQFQEDVKKQQQLEKERLSKDY
ncbi:MAG: hypothetical protein LUM44_17695 [Pyrinomonadaceae bacterium]|nr:hypothetical protein [Pyrinomonadaceae bacterium]